ncbi:M13-type metalloendopeptidase [Mycoplasma corogypsi]|uniref:M13-type metalloendopeptidase n=1 Tax=Mycoplasma corogypsi TaxID=2106 RepID=UPI0038736FE9
MNIKHTPKTDFYKFVNQEWLDTHEIPADKSSYNAFVELHDNLENLFKSLLRQWTQDESSIPNYPHIKDYVNFYKMVLNTQIRDRLGWAPVKSDLDKILDLKDFKSFNRDFKRFFKYSSLPLSFDVSPSFVDSNLNILWIHEMPTILPNTTMYQNKEEATKHLEAWREMMLRLLKSYGITPKRAETMVQKALDFDNLLKDYVLSAVEKANYPALYNPILTVDLDKKSSEFKIAQMCKNIVGEEVAEVAISNPRYFDNLDVIFNDSTFEGFKYLMFLRNIWSVASYLTEETREIVFEFNKVAYGVKENRSLLDFAYDLSSNVFDVLIGQFYAHTYFGKEAKKDVESMIANMIAVYERRLADNSWLTKETKAKAISKLNKIKVLVGYPDAYEPYYDLYDVKTYEQGGNLYSNLLEFKKAKVKYQFSQWNKKPDKRFWELSPVTVNAYYHPSFNQIVFPAAILADPFYNKNASKSANYGAIGVVIAHEISHAFDNNGAEFDEHGSLNNWWTTVDKLNFQIKTEKVVGLFEGVETFAGPVNGRLTVSENIADLSSLSCALEAAAFEENFDPEEFFVSYARIWRSKSQLENAKKRLQGDPHAPAETRVNVQLKNLDLFNEFYGLTKEDPMYLEPSERVKIW